MRYANFQEANRVFWRQTVLPLASRVGASMMQWLAQWFLQADVMIARLPSLENIIQ